MLERADVARVLQGDGVHTKLTEHAVRALVGLGPQESQEPSVA